MLAGAKSQAVFRRFASARRQCSGVGRWWEHDSSSWPAGRCRARYQTTNVVPYQRTTPELKSDRLPVLNRRSRPNMSEQQDSQTKTKTKQNKADRWEHPTSVGGSNHAGFPKALHSAVGGALDEKSTSSGIAEPYARQKLKRQEPGRRDDTCDHGLSRSWKV